MPGDIIFKTFRTFGHPYAYDRHTNTPYRLSEDEHRELVEVEGGRLPADQSDVIKSFQETGAFSPNVVTEIEHYGTMLVEQYLETRCKQLTLQVTQQCNLRCVYCVYSGSYQKQRTHSNQRMSLETAKKAVDFFLDHNSELPEVTIGHYGGEPLLEFGLIKQIDAYAKSKVEGKKILFNMTTNGTLITDEVADYLVENDYILNISLDGSKEEHDANRKFADGSGSFDAIISNIKKVRDRYPEYDKRIAISTTINPHMDMGCVLEYFSTDEIFSDRSIMFSDMSEKDYSGGLSYDRKHYMVRNYEYIKMLFSLIGKLDSKYISPLFTRTKGDLEHKLRNLAAHSQMGTTAHHGGPCFPGVRRLFVRADGALFPCERVSEMLDYFVIGSLEGGFDLEKIKSIINIGKLTEKECVSCWGLARCMLCAGQIEFDESPEWRHKIKECPRNLAKVASELHELCVLYEFGADGERAEVL